MKSRDRITPSARFSWPIQDCCCAVVMNGVFRGFGYFWLWIGLWVVSVLSLFRNNFVRHSCTAVMLNGVPSPASVLEKVVRYWGYTLVRRMGTLSGGPGSRNWGDIRHACLVNYWTLVEKRRLDISRCSSTIITRIGFQMSFSMAS